ncbi:MAG: ribose 5-phosphate isomerase B [Candidatus Atribacteria bacterium]|nr:ribose 5-phosphate isomerase B [Candidatus Atribacteria bacterium]MCD6349327.1 ribose 5-phosphate isomerase B [Candidatus Atribacteria bacterium]
MKILLGSDHGGYFLKEDLKDFLKELGHEVIDYGTYSADSCDYPDIAFLVATDLMAGKGDKAILVCGTGIGMCIAANKVKGVRAALCHDVFSAKASREHNNANVLTLGERVIGKGLAREIVRSWLEAEFTGGRHQRRVEKIMEFERNGN